MKTRLACVLLYLMIGCSKQDKQDSETIVYTNTNLKEMRSKPFNPILNDYTTKIVRVGFDHSSLNSLRGDTRFSSILKNYQLDLKNIKRYSYDYTPMEIIQIPVAHQTEIRVIVIYSHEGKYHFALGKEAERNGLKHVSYSVPMNESLVFWEFDLNKSNMLGNMKTYHSPFEGNRMHEVTSSRPREPLTSAGVDETFDDGIDEGVRYGCCSKPFDPCMQCFYNSCNTSWKCSLICTPLAVYCASSWIAACVTKMGCNYPIRTGDGEPSDVLPKLPKPTDPPPFEPINP